MGRAAHHVLHVKAVGRGAEIFNDRLAGGDDHGEIGIKIRIRIKIRSRKIGEGETEDFPVRGVFGGKEVKAVVLAKFGPLDLIAEGSQLFPLAVRTEEVKGEFAAVAVGHGGEEITAIVPGLEGDFRDARQALAQLEPVLRQGRAEAVEIDLLKEIQIGRGPFAGGGIAGVIDAGAVGVPRRAAAGGGAVDARDFIGQRLAGGGVVEEKRPVLASRFRKGKRRRVCRRGKGRRSQWRWCLWD